MEKRKDIRTRESEWRSTKNEAPQGVLTKRIPEPPVQVKFKGKSA